MPLPISRHKYVLAGGRKFESNRLSVRMECQLLPIRSHTTLPMNALECLAGYSPQARKCVGQYPL